MRLRRPLRAARACGLLLWLAACQVDSSERAADSHNPSAVADPAALVRTGNRQGPLACTLSGPEHAQAGAPLALALHIDRRLSHASVVVEVKLRLPEGVALEQGALEAQVAPSSEPNVELAYTLRAHALPAQPAVFVIDARGEGFGYHAELPYRFGRAPEPPSAPVRDRSLVRVGARNFGASVPISAQD